VRMQPDDDDLLSPPEEHEVFAAKHQPPVLPQHNHIYHISMHTMMKSTPEYAKWSLQQKQWFDNHISDHMAQLARQQEAALQQAAQVGMGGMPPQPQQGAQAPRPIGPAGEINQGRQIAGQNQGF